MQESLVIIINSPAHNPTGYSLTVNDWRNIKAIFEKTPQDKHVALFCDVAYIDFAVMRNSTVAVPGRF